MMTAANLQDIPQDSHQSDDRHRGPTLPPTPLTPVPTRRSSRCGNVRNGWGVLHSEDISGVKPDWNMLLPVAANTLDLTDFVARAPKKGPGLCRAKGHLPGGILRSAAELHGYHADRILVMQLSNRWIAWRLLGGRDVGSIDWKRSTR
jgi:hypothetical protein